MVMTELQLNIQFSVLAAQISIHMICGTFSQPANIANHFLHGFYNLIAYIINRPLFFKSWIHHWYQSINLHLWSWWSRPYLLEWIIIIYNLLLVKYKHCQEMQTFLLASIMPKYMSLQCVQSTDKLMCRPLQHYTCRQINLYRMFFADFTVNSQQIFM